MKLSSQIKPINSLKRPTAEIVGTLSAQGERLVITQKGETKVVPQDTESHEETQETTALLKMLALGKRQIEEDRDQPARDVLQRFRDRGSSS